MKTSLEELLRMKVEAYDCVNKTDVLMTPEFRVAVQEVTPAGVHFIIHANGFDSDTLDFFVCDNELEQI